MDIEQGAVRVIQVFLLESQFKRSNQLTYGEKDPIAVEIDLDQKVDTTNKRMAIEIFVTASITKEGVKEVEASIRMVGLFEYNDLPEKMLEEFPRINAPAIVFPFVREHLMSMTLKAGINPIVLAPVNFVQLSKRIEEAHVKAP